MTNDELDRAETIVAQIEHNMDPLDVRLIVEGDPNAQKPLGVLDMRGLQKSKTLRAAGFNSPFSGGPIPRWVKDGKR